MIQLLPQLPEPMNACLPSKLSFSLLPSMESTRTQCLALERSFRILSFSIRFSECLLGIGDQLIVVMVPGTWLIFVEGLQLSTSETI